MTTEEKSKAYAESIFKGAKGESKIWKYADEIHGIIQTAYLAGAAEALRSQWKDASKELPKPEKEVLIAVRQWGEWCCVIAWTLVFGDGRVEWHPEDSGVNPENIRFWMELPPLPNTEEK